MCHLRPLSSFLFLFTYVYHSTMLNMPFRKNCSFPVIDIHLWQQIIRQHRLPIWEPQRHITWQPLSVKITLRWSKGGKSWQRKSQPMPQQRIAKCFSICVGVWLDNRDVIIWWTLFSMWVVSWLLSLLLLS